MSCTCRTSSCLSSWPDRENSTGFDHWWWSKCFTKDRDSSGREDIVEAAGRLDAHEEAQGWCNRREPGAFRLLWGDAQGKQETTPLLDEVRKSSAVPKHTYSEVDLRITILLSRHWNSHIRIRIIFCINQVCSLYIKDHLVWILSSSAIDHTFFKIKVK